MVSQHAQGEDASQPCVGYVEDIGGGTLAVPARRVRHAPNQYVSVGAIYFPNVMDLYMYGYMAQKMVRTVDILYLDVRTDLWTIATTSR